MDENQTPLIPEIVENIDINDIPKTAQKGILLQDIIELVNKGLNYSQIARVLKCSKNNVIQRLKTVGYNQQSLENFKKHRGDIFAFIQSKLLNSINDETIKEMQPYQRIISTGVMYDKERLERGQSTQNIDTWTLTASLKDIERKKQDIMLEIRSVLEVSTNEPQ